MIDFMEAARAALGLAVSPKAAGQASSPTASSEQSLYGARTPTAATPSDNPAKVTELTEDDADVKAADDPSAAAPEPVRAKPIHI